jgi:hypothetical protein
MQEANMKTPKVIMDHFMKLERYGYQVGEDMTEDGKRFVFIARDDDSQEAFAVTWMYERKRRKVQPGSSTVH